MKKRHIVETYDSIDIIGGGIIGTTLATELLREIRRQGLKTEVHLFERRGQLGIENTEKSFEGVRTYWFTREEIRFYLASIRAMEDLESYFGEDGRFEDDDGGKISITTNYRQLGYHYFLSEKDFNEARKRKSLFDSENIPIEFYTKDEADEIGWIHNNFDLDARVLDEDAWVYQNFNLDVWMTEDFNFNTIIPKTTIRRYDIAGYVHVPIAGFISAGDLIASYRAVFEKLGGKLHLNTEVVGLGIRGNRINTLQYRFWTESEKPQNNHGAIETKPTDYVVNAAGVWSDGLNQKILGEMLGVTPHRRFPVIVRSVERYQPDHGMVLLNQRVIRPDHDKLWLYFTPKLEKPGIQVTLPDDRTFDEYFFKYIFPVFCDKEKPFIRHAETLGLYSGIDSRGWMGHYADTPDERPLIGLPRPEKLKNYGVSIGFSGHGVQASIAAALGLTHKILRLEDRPIVEIPGIYSASRDLSQTRPDHSRL